MALQHVDVDEKNLFAYNSSTFKPIRKEKKAMIESSKLPSSNSFL